MGRVTARDKDSTPRHNASQDSQEASSSQRERSRPISMLRWRPQTQAFVETSAHPAADASSDGDSTNLRRDEPSAAPEATARTEKPVIIRGATSASAASPREEGHQPNGIRSSAGRIVLIAGIIATLFASLAVVAPAGAGAGLPAVLTSYANAMPWTAPTSTARTTTTGTSAGVTTNISGGTPTQQAIIADIESVFGPYATGALNVARCESSFDPHAWNPTPILGSHASGVFQILYPSTWNGTSYRGYSPYDEWANVRAAYEIFKRDGYSWREWQCKP